MKEIYELLRAQMGHDFSGYKTKTFLRRVQRRKQVNQIENREDYVALLRQDPKEVAALFRDMLINVTNFFRDTEESLAVNAVPKLFEGRGADDIVRVWVPGCATGEEVYSIAILLREHMDTLRNVPGVQLFATDIDDSALNVARAARYPLALLDSVSDERRKRFFVEDGGSYVITKNVREMCIFSPHSVLRDPPFSRIDLVSCRNLLIYFGIEAQKQVIPTFRYALRPGGFLFLGTSESLSQFDDMFVPLDKRNRIFRTREGGATPILPIALPGHQSHFPQAESRRRPLPITPLRLAVETQVLDRHAPPHVVATAEGDIVNFSARTGKYFEAPAGVPNRQLLAMERKGLRLDLRSAFRESMQTGRSVTCDGVEFEDEEDRVQLLTLKFETLLGSGDERLFLITFEDHGATLSAEEAQTRPRRRETSGEVERELRDTRERLQSTIEEYETALEELKSTNEELISVNEEMQSTNEEMEASKEEMQALNDELHTVNTELNLKLEALDSANADLKNLFDVTDMASIFLDSSLIIRRFTPAATRLFKVLPSDCGRPLTDLASDLMYPELFDDLRQVLTSGESTERQIVGVKPDSHYLVRTVPYRDRRGSNTGVVVSIVDVSVLAASEAHQRTLIAELNHRVKNMLAVVLAIAFHTRRAALTLDEFYPVFEGRMAALTRSYELLSVQHWKKVLLSEIVKRELVPFGLERVAMDGDDVALCPRAALSMGMIVHELTTNAAKFGALSNEHGRLALRWTNVHERVSFEWREIGGPQIEIPATEGFGMKLIHLEADRNMRGESKIEFRPDGLVVRLTFDCLIGDTL